MALYNVWYNSLLGDLTDSKYRIRSIWRCRTAS
jgi:hypothetical protein